MKKIVQKIYLVLFIGIIGLGTLVNLPHLCSTVTETIHNSEYAAWSTLIGLDYNEKFVNKYDFINANGFFRKILGQREMNSVIKLNNDKLAVPLSCEDVTVQVQITKEFHEWLQEEQIKFSYIQVPYEICKYDAQLPTGVEDYSNADADVFLKLLGQEEVPYMDLREEMHNAGIDHYEAFFGTDHHWKIETSFWAYSVVCEYIEDLLGVQVPEEYTAAASYYVETYEDCVLGSNGRKTGIAYAGLDDITLIYPKFDTQVSFFVPEEDIYREGDFQEAYMTYERLEGDNLYEMLQYNVYIGEDYSLTQQVCNDAPCDKKVLLIKDSYFRPVQAFLGTAFTQVDTIDMRYYTGDVREYIKESKPDIVLLCYNPYMVHDISNFRFNE